MDENRKNGFACLAVDASSPTSSVAACSGSRQAVRSYAAAGQQSRRIFVGASETLSDVGLALGQLDCIAFGSGPGGFTGLRVAAAVAQSLAFGAGLPVCSVSSLAVLAAGAARKHGVTRIAVCLDARMGEAYAALYEYDGSGEIRALVPDSLIDPMTYEFSEAGKFFAAGTGWRAFPFMAESHAASISGLDETLEPDAVDLLVLAESRFTAGAVISPEDAVPTYIRDKVTG
jgi:tRNA threonylcarbamoyladenosine biosynthesis protein TsaB